MTNEDFHSLRMQIINLLEGAGFQGVRVQGSLGYPAYEFDPTITGVAPVKFRVPPPDAVFTLDLNVSAKLAPGEFHFVAPEEHSFITPEEQLHGK
jgi:hypothetical protein